MHELPDESDSEDVNGSSGLPESSHECDLSAHEVLSSFFREDSACNSISIADDSQILIEYGNDTNCQLQLNPS